MPHSGSLAGAVSETQVSLTAPEDRTLYCFAASITFAGPAPVAGRDPLQGGAHDLGGGHGAASRDSLPPSPRFQLAGTAPVG
jgi:hypothetical protein